MKPFIDDFYSFCDFLKIERTKFCIFVEIGEQKLYLFENGGFKLAFNVSTSRKAPSCVKDSLGTPLGLHFIDGKIGENEDLDTVFIARKPVGKISQQPDDTVNMITTRIMRLRGLQEGVNRGGNVDTFERFVYIHGTNQTEKIGTPNSHGCVLLAPNDMKKLFDIVDDKSLVYIYIDKPEFARS